jgi:hypothetical protein
VRQKIYRSFAFPLAPRISNLFAGGPGSKGGVCQRFSINPDLRFTGLKKQLLASLLASSSVLIVSPGGGPEDTIR